MNKLINKLTGIVLVFAVIISTIVLFPYKADASEKPAIELNLSTTGASVAPIKLYASVTSGNELAAVKYTSGRHKPGFFKSEKYAYRVKNMAFSGTESNRTFKIRRNATYTFYAEDIYGNYSVQTIKISNMKEEERAVWVSFLEFSDEGYTEEEFDAHIDEMFDTIKADNFNTVYAIVRPFSDAMYPSKYFPYSVYCSGTQGLDPGFDPFQYMVNAAKLRGLKIYAYINPYRVCKKAEYKKMYKGDGSVRGVLDGTTVNPANPAYVWANDDNPDNDRNVLYYSGYYYYNPAVPEVQNLIVDGVKEIIENYDVDGIIFDDYFYPTLGSKYKKLFDYKEYNAYIDECNANGTVPEFNNIADWRRNNISTLVKSVYEAVKNYNSSLKFGISPAGNPSNLRSDQKYYVDIDKWCSNDGYIDFIAPQLYWGFTHKICPFEGTVQNWINIVSNKSIDLYITLPMHDAEAFRVSTKKKDKADYSDEEKEWTGSTDVLARMIKYIRNNESELDGFSLFRYNFMTDPYLTSEGARTERDNVVKEMK